MPDNPIIDTINTGGVTYDIVGKKVRNTNTSSTAPQNVSVWYGTKEEYDEIQDRDPATVYEISNKSPTQTVYDSTLTIQQNGSVVGTFTANSSVDKTINITTPTTYVYEQATASATWVITHNLGKHPSVTVVDSAGEVQGAKETYIDNNTIKIEFNNAFTGKAYLN